MDQINSQPSVAVKDLHLAYGSVNVLNHLTLDIAEGEFIVVVGPSGCGKSTLLKVLAGLLPQTEGGADLKGTPIRGPRRDIGVVFQSPVLFPWRSVLGNVMLPADVQRLDPAEMNKRALDLIHLVGLSGFEDRYPRELSGGMQQRVGLARALAAETDILLMDEAFSALDPLIRREMQEQLLELQATLGKTIVFITHDLNEAMFLGDRIAVMRDGRIVQIGTPEDILTDPANEGQGEAIDYRPDGSAYYTVGEQTSSPFTLKRVDRR